MFVELHAKSAFSFLEATALPEALAGRAVALEQPALALVDTDGVYGAPAFYRACTRLGITPLVGAEVSLMDGGRLPLLVEDQEGYKNLCRLLTRVKMRAAKCEGAAGWDDLEEHVGGLVCLTGGASGPVAAALAHGGHEAARATLDRLAGLFGRFDHGPAIFGSGSHGLLAEDVNSRPRGSDGEVGVLVVWRGDVHRVDLAAFYQLIVFVIGINPFDPVLPGYFARLLLVAGHQRNHG